METPFTSFFPEFEEGFKERNDLISYLKAKKVRLGNVVKLFVESWNLANSDLHSLYEILPNVELSLCGRFCIYT